MRYNFSKFGKVKKIIYREYITNTHTMNDRFGVRRGIHRTTAWRRQRHITLRIHIELHGIDDELFMGRQLMMILGRLVLVLGLSNVLLLLLLVLLHIVGCRGLTLKMWSEMLLLMELLLMMVRLLLEQMKRNTIFGLEMPTGLGLVLLVELLVLVAGRTAVVMEEFPVRK